MKIYKKINRANWISFLLVLICSIYMGYYLGSLLYHLENSKEVNILKNDDIYEIPTEIYDIHKQLITKFFVMKRDIVLYKDIPKKVIHTLLLVEDEDFYEHYGINLLAISRAFFKNLVSWKIVQGASTLNQQLAKLAFTSHKRTIERKIWDIWFSFLLEKRYSKREIIEKYLNMTYFGHGIYGISTASKYFFNKSLKKLDYVEIALLISLLRGPNKYSPFKNPELAKKRQKSILYRLASNNLIPMERVEFLFDQFWIKFSSKIVHFYAKGNYFFDLKENKAPYFSEYIRKILKTDFYYKHIKKYIEISEYKNDIQQIFDRKNERSLFTSGFKIYTTLDLKKQEVAKDILLENLKKQDEIFWMLNQDLYAFIQKKYTRLADFVGLSFLNRFNFEINQKEKKVFEILKENFLPLEVIGLSFTSLEMKNFYQKYYDFIKKKEFLFNLIQGLVFSLNPKTGNIEIMIGGRDFYKNQFNRVFSKRQPGSAFKIFVYGAAFDTGLFTPSTTMIDEPIKFYNSIQNTFWSPVNADKNYRGIISLKDAFKYSINTIAVKLTSKIGIEKVLKFFHRFSPEDPSYKKNMNNLSIALGTLEVSPFDMAKSLAVIFNQGYQVFPNAILRIEDRNSRIIYDKDIHNQKRKRKIMSTEVVRYMEEILRAVMEEGTGYQAVHDLSGYFLGKTGTSQNNRDLWFVGGDPNLVTSIWVGFDRGGVSLGKNQYGGNVSAKIWADIMKKINKISN